MKKELPTNPAELKRELECAVRRALAALPEGTEIGTRELMERLAAEYDVEPFRLSGYLMTLSKNIPALVRLGEPEEATRGPLRGKMIRRRFWLATPYVEPAVPSAKRPSAGPASNSISLSALVEEAAKRFNAAAEDRLNELETALVNYEMRIKKLEEMFNLPT